MLMASLLRAAVFLALLAVSIPSIFYFLHEYQDADLTLHFYDNFGVAPASVLRGKVVWITGASSGIGEQLAYKFIKHGSKVALSARRVKELERVRDNCLDIAKERNPRLGNEDILIVPMELKDFGSHKGLTDRVLKHFGQIDVLINNAGLGSIDWIRRTPFEIIRGVLDVNLLGTISLTNAVLPHMLERRQGHIGVVNSVFGKIGGPGFASYTASKFALQGYFDALRLELLNRNIDVTNYIIGPVGPTAVFGNAPTGNYQAFKDRYRFPEGFHEFVSAARCAQLMVTATVNRVDEPWISRHPALYVTYLSQYMPSLYQWYSKTVFYDWLMDLAKRAGLPPP